MYILFLYIYIYILLSLKYLPRPLLISNVDYVPQLWHRQLPLQSRTWLCKDQAHPRPLPFPKGPVTFCPLLTDAEAGRRKPWSPSSAPSFAACWGSHWGEGGSCSPAVSGQWWGWACSSHSTFSGWQKGPGPHLATREPLQQLSGKETPAKVTKVIRGSKRPKGQVKDPGDDEAPRIQSPRPLC